MEMIGDVRAESERSEERLLHVFEIEDQTLVHTVSSGRYGRDLRRGDRSHASVSETAILLWRKGLI